MKRLYLLFITAIFSCFSMATEVTLKNLCANTTSNLTHKQQYDFLAHNFEDLDGNNFKPLSKSKHYSYVVVFEAFQSWEGDGPEKQIKKVSYFGDKVQVSMIQPNININDSVLESFRKDFGLENTHVLIDRHNKLTSALGVWQTPTHFLFDNKGCLLGKVTGQSNELVNSLKQLLKGQ